MSGALLSVDGLDVFFGAHGTQVQALHGVSFDVAPGEVVGLVGESGSGKTVTSLALMGLLDPRTSRVQGEARLRGEPLWSEAGRLRPHAEVPMAMVFQEPMTALDPVFRIGHQLVETLRRRQGLNRRQATARAAELLDQVGIPDPRARLRAYPHELSGGMRQRVVIALALACSPRLLIADEPTTAVDATIQAQLLELIAGLARDEGMGVVFVTHDLGVVAQMCHRMITMYAGRVIESGPVVEVLARPLHPYTSGLLAALPAPRHRGGRLPTIPGAVPAPGTVAEGCVFADRCAHTRSACEVTPDLRPVPDGRSVRCARAEELRLTGSRS
ncbi:ABC transporter ATP-binding protein [Nocardioides carbamazepini]|uniref:ABC transporter ATP-binding protein n=1 Tax=Nocardioides carbamazepini TaxID=2854259 RepID=UPI002149BB22|nr:ABC transporter ATP-binding protein [Nocardioides carbamazepini]MCR1784123.1 ABC transporter ATP-binding protein [Nocardioides carbamazepini]